MGDDTTNEAVKNVKWKEERRVQKCVREREVKVHRLRVHTLQRS